MGQTSGSKKKRTSDGVSGVLGTPQLKWVEDFVDENSTVEWEDKPLVYISGPMCSEGHPYRNINVAVKTAQEARLLGWSVLIPHLNALAEMITGEDNVVNILDNDFNLLSRCDAVLVLPYKVEENSEGVLSGTAQELNFAEDHNIPIFTLETLPPAVEFDRWCDIDE